jgi:hypothetical protein
MTNAALTTSATLTDVTGQFRIGRVFKNTFRQFAKNFWFVLLEVIIMVIVLSTLFKVAKFGDINNAFSTYSIFLRYFVEKVSIILPNAIILAATIHNLSGRPLKIREAIRLGASRFFPLLAVSLIASLAVLSGMVLLIVPGIILVTMWFVAGAACVGEQLGPIESLKRSQALTKSFRWQIFAIYVIVLVGGFIITEMLKPIVPIAMIYHVDYITLNVILTIDYIWIGIYYAFGATLVANVFHELRMLKEGIPAEAAASVFE